MSRQNSPKNDRKPCNTSRNVVVSFRLSWNEYLKLKKLAGERQVSKFIRDRIFGGKFKHGEKN